MNKLFFLTLLLFISNKNVFAQVDLSVAIDEKTGIYTVSLDGEDWYESPDDGFLVCTNGKRVPSKFVSKYVANGTDAFGDWTGETLVYSPANNVLDRFEITFQKYVSDSSVVVGRLYFPNGLNTAGCGLKTDQAGPQFPVFNTSKAKSPSLSIVSWESEAVGIIRSTTGLAYLNRGVLDDGPVVSSDSTKPATLVWSTLDNHKIITQNNINGQYSMGLSGAIPSIPINWSYSIIFSASAGGITQGVYEYGERIRTFSSTTRSPSVTLDKIGYYTDDGSYYYVWGGAKEYNDPQLSSWLPPRPWAAEEGLVLVKEVIS